MNKIDVENKIKSVSNFSQYVRVSENHSLELYLGKNEKGYPTLRYNGNFTPIKIVGNSLLEIKQVKTTNYNSILFCFTSKDNLSLFYNFCADIITQTEHFDGSKDGYIEIVNRYAQWKKMFYGSSKTLTENEIMGLIGELLFLKNYAFKIHGTTVGLKGWSAPEPTHKDFSFENEWFEIKSVNSHKNSVLISSIEQLDSEIEGKLIIYSFEKMSPSFKGLTLNNLVSSINEILILDTDKDIFIEKLKQIGYSYDEVYDNYVYECVSIDKYIVSKDFPRLTSKNIPIEIGKIQYEIILSMIEKYKENN